MENYTPVIFAVAVLLLAVLVYMYSQNSEGMVAESVYGLMSGGLNLPSRDGSYLGAISALNAAEQVRGVSDVKLDLQ